MTEPTDAEIDVMVAAYLGDCGPQATRVYSFARAQPVGQPDAYAAGMGDPLVVAAPTPQADSQPAPANTRQIAECYGDCPEDPKTCANPCKFEGRAARAPADSALEDAARYRWIRGPVEESTRYSRWRIEYWDGPNGWQPMQRERMDSAIDAARKQGGA